MEVIKCKECPVCHKMTNVISYFLNYDLEKYDEFFESRGNIGLGHVPFLDKKDMDKYLYGHINLKGVFMPYQELNHLF